MKEEKLLQHDPLSEADRILRDDFYGRGSPEPDDAPVTGRRRARATTAAQSCSPAMKGSPM